MKTMVLIGLCLGIAVAAKGQKVLTEYDWQKLEKPVSNALVATIDGRTVLKISNTNETGLRVQVLKIDHPAITKKVYGLVGEVKYQGVKGDGFLEMWNFFPAEKPGQDERGFFSRTLGASGAMGKITGTSGWREFKLPFDHTGIDTGPTHLEINVILPGPGTVYLGSVKLLEYDGNLSGAITPPGAWWSDRNAGLIGGIGGAVIGCLGALLGLLSSRGKSPHFVLTTMKLLAAIGGVSTLAGVVAILSRQPYGVYYPLLLGGIIMLAVFSVNLRNVRKHYEALELRRMNSMDA